MTPFINKIHKLSCKARNIFLTQLLTILKGLQHHRLLGSSRLSLFSARSELTEERCTVLSIDGWSFVIEEVHFERVVHVRPIKRNDISQKRIRHSSRSTSHHARKPGRRAHKDS